MTDGLLCRRVRLFVDSVGKLVFVVVVEDFEWCAKRYLCLRVILSTLLCSQNKWEAYNAWWRIIASLSSEICGVTLHHSWSW